MSLKSLIQRLLDSRTTPAQAAHSALRNTSSFTSIFTGEQTYTAPEDGFITVEGKSEANGGSAIGISSNGENYFLRTFQSVKDWGQAVTAPVSKGETVSISLYNLTDIEVKFYKSFGGGYQTLKKALLAGGVLCRLKHLCNSLQRNSLLARRNGWLNSLVQNSRPLILAHRPQEIGWNLSHRKQDTFALRPTLSKFLFKYLGFGRAVSPVKKATRVSIFTWKKGKPSRISYLLMLRAPSLLSTERRASAHNLTVGGASC